MTIDQKYEWQTPLDANPAIAVHRRLGREVSIHVIDSSSVSTKQRKAIRDTVSKLTKLDHPAIPCLVDFVEQDGKCYVVLESYPRAPDDQSAHELLDELVIIEQLADSLVHARGQGIVHGDIDRSRLGIDAQGDFRLLGLGLKQIHNTDTDLRAAANADLCQICKLIHQIAARHEPTAQPPTTDERTEEQETKSLELSRQTSQLASLTTEFVDDENANLTNFHPRFRQWLQRELATREAKKLSFTDKQTESTTAWYNRPAILSAIGGALFVIIACLVLLWPTDVSPEQEISKTIKNAPPKFEPANTHPDIRERIQNSTVSPLKDDGRVFINPNVTPPVEEPKQVDAEPDAVPAEKAIEEEIESQVEEKPSPDMEVLPKAKPKQRTESPFKDAPNAITLPKTTETTSTTIVASTLQNEEKLKIRLIGGERTLRQSGHKIRGSESQGWTIDYVKDKKSNSVAKLKREDGNLNFRWLDFEGKKSAEAAHLCNAALSLESGNWKHILALREYQSLPMLALNLERKKPYEFKLQHPPNSQDIMIEFLSNNDSLATALPKSIIEADGGKMRIGLDAGKDSLIVVQFEPRIKSRPSFLIRGSARPIKDARFIPIKPGAGKGLQADAMRMSQALFQLKNSKDGLKNQQKKLVDNKIKALEKDKEQLDAFIESYAIAAQTKLNLRVYRQIGPHQIPLIQFGGE